MDDDGYWKDVEAAYQDCVIDNGASGVKRTENEMWELAKERTQWRYLYRRAAEKAKREGRDYWDVAREEEKIQREEKKRREEFANN